ncbi:MAG: hypothetical protein RL651_1886 [Pseudomonadota bacterium]|jgi:uncharacterized protein YcbK (DUF882 family)
MKHEKHDRRQFLRKAVRLTAGGVALPFAGAASAAYPQRSMQPAVTGLMASGEQRILAFNHTHTRERVDLAYAINDQYVPDALKTLNRFMRDHYSGTVGQMDPQLFDLLHQVRQALGGTSLPAFEVISGYRCPETNNHLRNSRGGGVAKRSLHMEGKAIDVRLPGVPLAELRDAAISLEVGGVGYYPSEQFVHIDTGKVRRWG